MNIVSWNVNGLRAVHKKGYWQLFMKQDPDILCLQETKARMDQLPVEIQKAEGYHAFFNAPTVKKGYSGTAIYTKILPDKVEYGMGIEELDQEGRLVIAYFKKIVLINGYFPNGGGGPERLAYKFKFYDAFLNFTEGLRKKGYGIIFCGDVNTAHEAIDLARPKENEKNTGFLPEERAWIDEVVLHGYLDTFRYLYPNKIGAYTYWDMKSGARDRNVGWRIDYFFISNDLQKKIKRSEILTDIFGSDHCPILLDLDVKLS